jgi:hypothetical protein
MQSRITIMVIKAYGVAGLQTRPGISFQDPEPKETEYEEQCHSYALLHAGENNGVMTDL